MAITSPSRDLYHLQNNSSLYLPLLSPTVTPSHEDSDPYYELLFVPFQPPTKIDLDATPIRESTSCKLNIFNPKDVLMTALLTAPPSSTGVRIETLRVPLAEAENPVPNLKESFLYHLPPNSSALIRITWSPVTPDDLYTSLVFKWGCRFTSKVVLYGKVQVVTRKSQRILFGDTQTTFVKHHLTSAFRAPLSTLGLNSPHVDKKPPAAFNPISSHTFLDVDDSALSLPSQSFVASTPMDRNATRIISAPADNTFTHPSVIKRFAPKNKDVSMVAAARRSLSFSVQAPGGGTFDSQWADKQICAFTYWLNFVLTPPDSSNFTSIQSESSPPAKRYSINLTASFRGMNSMSDTLLATGEPKYTVTQRKYLNLLRSNMEALSIDPQFTSVLYSLHAEIEKCRIKIRPEKPVWKDVGLKEDLIRTLLSYHPLWLRLGLEVVFKCKVPVTHEMDSRTIHKFLTLNLFSSRNISAKFSHRKVPGLFTKGYDLAISKHIMFKFFSLVLFLDMAKQQKLINHDPCLFKASRTKSSREMLLYFSSNFLQGEGDITKHLNNFGYRVYYKQSFLDEFDYKVKNLATDLRDGVRLSRLLELLTQDWGLSQKLRLPATSMNPKLANNRLFLEKLKEVTKMDFGISSKDIATGHKEKTLSLIWALIFHFHVDIKLDEFLLRREIAYIRAKHSIHNKCVPINQTSNIGSEHSSTILHLLLDWCSVICSVFGIRVTDFTSSFKDGRALCYILHYYHPSLLSKHFISDDARSNLEEFSEKLSSLGGVPTIPPPSDFQTGPNEKVVIMYLSYLCAQQLELTEEIRAAIVIQRALKRHMYRQQQAELEQSSYDSQLLEFHTQTQAAVAIQSVFRGYLVRRERSLVHSDKHQAYTSLNEDMEHSAVVIQSMYRGYRARTELTLAILQNNIQLGILSNSTVEQVLRDTVAYLSKERLDAVVTLQNCYRTWSATRLAQSLKHTHATLCIQSHWRSFKVRSLYISQRSAVILIQQTFRKCPVYLKNRQLEKETKAAVILQSMCRGFLVRREISRRMENENIILQEQYSAELVQSILHQAYTSLYVDIEHSAVVIQSVYRGYRARTELTNLRISQNEIQLQILSNSTIDHVLRDTVSCLSRERLDAILVLQNCYRTWSTNRITRSGIQLQILSNSTVDQVLRNTVAGLSKERLDAILTLQNCYRTWSATRLAYSTRNGYLYLKTCVITIQRAYRRRRDAIESLKHTRVTLCIQSHWRSFKVRSLYISQRLAVVLIQQTFRKCPVYLKNRQLEKETRAAVILQSMCRGFLVRREISRRIVNRNFILQEQYSAELVQNILHQAYTSLDEDMEHSAVVIQSMYRGYRARTELTLAILQNNIQLGILSNSTVEQVLRDTVAYLSKERLDAVVTLQNCYRTWSASRLAQSLKHTRATLCIQSHWRSFKVRSLYISQRSAVVLIQQTFRKCPVYLKNRQLEKETRAAVIIQSFYRGFLIRRSMQSSLVTINRRLSDATKSADESDKLKNKIPKYLDILLHSRSLSQKYDILDNLKTAVYVSESCAIRVRKEGLVILYMLVDNNVRSPSIMQRVEKAADVLLQMTKWPSIANDVFMYGQSIPIIADLLQKIYTTQPSTVRILCHLLIAFCKYPDQVATIHSMHNESLHKIHKLLSNLKRKYSVGAARMLIKARKDLAQSIHEMERVFTHFRYVT